MTTLSPEYSLYLYQQLTKQITHYKQTKLDSLDELLASEGLSPFDFDFDSTRELAEALAEKNILKITVFKKAQVFFTVLPHEEFDAALAALDAANSADSAGQAGSTGGAGKNGKAGKIRYKKRSKAALKPRKPKHKQIALPNENSSVEDAPIKESITEKSVETAPDNHDDHDNQAESTFEPQVHGLLDSKAPEPELAPEPVAVLDTETESKAKAESESATVAELQIKHAEQPELVAAQDEDSPAEPERTENFFEDLLEQIAHAQETQDFEQQSQELIGSSTFTTTAGEIPSEHAAEKTEKNVYHQAETARRQRSERHYQAEVSARPSRPRGDQEPYNPWPVNFRKDIVVPDAHLCALHQLMSDMQDPMELLELSYLTARADGEIDGNRSSLRFNLPLYDKAGDRLEIQLTREAWSRKPWRLTAIFLGGQKLDPCGDDLFELEMKAEQDLGFGYGEDQSDQIADHPQE